jgi:WD40 repeat protein
VDVDRGTEVTLEAADHQPVMQWQLTNSNKRDGVVHIQVGTLTSGGWYVRHRGFGSRRFADKAAAWRAARGLMEQHQGKWEQVTADSRPFLTLLRPDGSRVLYDNQDSECLYACWGDKKDLFWDRYEAAIDAGRVLRETETHALLGGFYYLIQYTDPLDGSQRYALTTCRSEGVDYHVVDYPDPGQADQEYEEFVLGNEDDEFPYKSSDVVCAAVDRTSRLPDGLTQLPSGEIIATDDLEEYNRIYGLPSRVEWPPSPGPAIPPGAVSGATAEPRDWGPAEVTVHDITPAAWSEEGEELRPNALALAVLPDGRQLLASGHDGAARVWNIGDGAEVRMVSGHSEWVLSVALATLSDGKTVVATGGKDGLARVWSVREHQALQEIEAQRRPVNSVAWAFPPGDVPWLVAGGDDATVGIWDVDSGLSRRSFEVGEPSINIVWSVAAAVLADGHVYVVAGVEEMNGGSVYVWDATTGTRLHKHAVGPSDDPLINISPRVAMTVLPDRSFRVAAIAGPEVRVWDGQTGQEVLSVSVPWKRSNGDVALTTLPDLRVAVAATSGQQTLVCDTESGATLARLDHQGSDYHPIVELAARPDGGLLLAVGRTDDHPARITRLDIRW